MRLKRNRGAYVKDFGAGLFGLPMEVPKVEISNNDKPLG
jgi:hypothetical protein